LSGTIFLHGTAVWSSCFMGRGRKESSNDEFFERIEAAAAAAERIGC
jgi:hypothetical protein